MKHFIIIPFTGLGFGKGFSGEDWYSYRASLFNKLTLNSLKAQTSKNFTLESSLQGKAVFLR